MSNEGKALGGIGPKAIDRLHSVLRGPNDDPVSACDVAWLLDCSVGDVLDELLDAQAKASEDDAPKYVVDTYGNFSPRK